MLWATPARALGSPYGRCCSSSREPSHFSVQSLHKLCRMEMQALRGPGTSPTAARTVGARTNDRVLPTDLEAIQALLNASGDANQPLELRRWLEQAEAWYIARTLRALKGNRSAAARALGIGRRTLYAKMQKLGIEASWSPGSRP